MIKTSPTHAGFTLIELMMVVAIIGILASIALPAFQIYTVRAKLIETTGLSGAAKTRIWEEYATNARMPEEATSTADGIAETMNSKYISATAYTKIDNNNASLEITLQNLGLSADAHTMIFVFQTDTRHITMDCKGGTLEDIYRPAPCRSNS